MCVYVYVSAVIVSPPPPPPPSSSIQLAHLCSMMMMMMLLGPYPNSAIHRVRIGTRRLMTW